MCYPDSEYYITLFFQLLKEFEAATPLTRTERRGAPKVHADRCLIVFFALMLLKQIHRFKAQNRWLLTHPDWLSKLHFGTCPSRVTLSRRYKQLGLPTGLGKMDDTKLATLLALKSVANQFIKDTDNDDNLNQLCNKLSERFLERLENNDF